MSKCGHKDVVKKSLVHQPTGFVIKDSDCAEISLCMDCGEWLPLGDANDNGDAMIELRAEEMAVEFGESGFYSWGGWTKLELMGWAMHAEVSADDMLRNLCVPTNREMQAGWLANTIWQHYNLNLLSKAVADGYSQEEVEGNYEHDMTSN